MRVLHHYTHGLRITQLTNKVILLLRHLYKCQYCRIGQEHILRDWKTLHQFHDSICLLKVPKQKKKEHCTSHGRPAKYRLIRYDFVDFVVEVFIRLQIDCGTHSYLGVNYVRNEVLDVLVAAVDKALLVVHQVEKDYVEAGW